MKLYNLKTNKYLLFLILITLVFIIFIFFILRDINKNNQLITKLEDSFIFTKNNFEEQKEYALSLAVLLSEDKEILESFEKKNKKESFELINRRIKTFKQLQNSDFEIQIYNKDFTTYIRSWDSSKDDAPLRSLKRGVREVKRTKEPIVSIELGKRLNIRAISPLMKNDEYIGALKVLINFEQLTKELEQKGLSIFVLLNNKYLNIATELKKNQQINRFTLVNQYGQNINNFKNLNFEHLKDFGYFTNKELAFSYFSFYSCKREKIGYVIVSSKNESKMEIDNDYEKKTKQKVNGIIIE